MDRYIAVANDENGPEDAITELPIEENNTISLEDIQAHFPGAIALRYRHNQKWRVVRFADGIFSLPAGWDQHQYIVVSSHGGNANMRDTSRGLSVSLSRQEGLNVELDRPCTVILGLGGFFLTAYYRTNMENQGLFLNVLMEFLKKTGSQIQSILPGSLLVELQFDSPEKCSQFVSEEGSVKKRLSEEFCKVLGINGVTVEIKTKEEVSKQKKEIGSMKKDSYFQVGGDRGSTSKGFETEEPSRPKRFRIVENPLESYGGRASKKAKGNANMRNPFDFSVSLSREEGLKLASKLKLALDRPCTVILGLGGFFLTAYYRTSMENQRLFLNILIECLKSTDSLIQSIRPAGPGTLVELQFNSPGTFSQFVSEEGSVKKRLSEEFYKVLGINGVIVEFKTKEEVSKQKKEIGSKMHTYRTQQRGTSSKKRQNVYKFKQGNEIKNIPGTTGRRPADSDSWENFKSKITGESKGKRKCQVRRCIDTNTVGAHVRIKGRGRKDYIVDLCSRHNSAENKGYMKVTAATKAARVTKEEIE